MIDQNHCLINLFPAMKNTKNGSLYGYINSHGDFIIEPEFSQARDFTTAGIASVAKDNHWGIIDSNGTYVVKPLYDYISPFKDNRAIFTKNSIMGVLNEHGNIIPTKAYNFINDFNEGLASVSIITKTGGTLVGYIDKEGNEAIPLTYSEGSSFNNGFALVKNSKGIYELIDKTGKVKTTFPYKNVGNLNDNYLTFSSDGNGMFGYMNLKGEILIKPKFTMVSPVEENYIIASTSTTYIGKFGVITLYDTLIFPYIYNDIQYLKNNRFAVGTPRTEDGLFMNNLYALGNEKGGILTAFTFKNIGKYRNILASASDLKYTYFIDLMGKRVKSLPSVEGTGSIAIKCGIVYADTDYWPMYLTTEGNIIYEPNALISLDEKYSVLKVKYKPNINYLIYYPQLQGVTPLSTEIAINAKLRDLSDLQKIHEDQVLDYDKYGNFQVLYFEKDLFIPDISIYNFPFGAAHGLTSRKTPSINLKTGEFYSLSDLFKGGIYWTKYINDIISNMIKTNKDYEYVYPDGFKGITPDQSFYVDKDNLYIYFSPYDIAPYAAGFVTFKIPFKEIDSLINKESSFYTAFN